MSELRNPSSVKITLEPMGRRVEVVPGTTILQAAQEAGASVTAVCGGNGTCGLCKVKLVEGIASVLSPEEIALLTPQELLGGMRLACQAKIESDCVLHFPPESLSTLQRLQLEGQEVNVEIDSRISNVEIKITPEDTSSEQRILRFVETVLKQNFGADQTIPAGLVKSLMEILQKNLFQVSLVLADKKLVAILPPHSPITGFAVDIGTTKIAAFLVDLKTGQTLESAGLSNPQIAYGENVIDRIKFADENPLGGETLQRVLIQALNSLIEELVIKSGLSRANIFDCVMVCNTAIHHMLLGLPLHSLGEAPFSTTEVNARTLPARAIGIDLPDYVQLYLPPNIAGFVGGDHVAMLLSTKTRNLQKTTLAIDIGTNTEISLVHAGEHFSCSCASGPAFEGAHIHHGLRAIPGAIEKVFIHGNETDVQTISGKPAIGICGSGILDAISEMRKERILDARGAFNRTDHRITYKNNTPELVLVKSALSGIGENITINRRDINQIQLAKAAIRSGIEILLRNAKLDRSDIELVLLAGAFGTYIDIRSAIRVGMFPNIPLDRFQQVGNAAGSGARDLLVSKRARLDAEEMTADIKHVELVKSADYTDVYINAIGLV